MIIIVIDISLEITFSQFVKVLGGSWAAWSFASSFWSVCQEVIGRCNCDCTKSLDYVSESLWVSSVAESLWRNKFKGVDFVQMFWLNIFCIQLGTTGGPKSEVYLVHKVSKAKTATTRAKDWIRCDLWELCHEKSPASTVQHLGIVRPFRRFRMSCFFFLEHDWILMSFWVASGEIQATWR